MADIDLEAAEQELRKLEIGDAEAPAEEIEEPQTLEEPAAPAPRTFDIDGEVLSEEDIRELKRSGLRQADYTRKTQMLAQEKAALERDWGAKVQTVTALDKWLTDNQEEAELLFKKIEEKSQRLQAQGATQQQVLHDPVVNQLATELMQVKQNQQLLIQERADAQLDKDLQALRARVNADAKERGIVVPEYDDKELCAYCAQNRITDLEAGWLKLHGKKLLDGAVKAGETKFREKLKGKSDVRVESSGARGTVSIKPKTQDIPPPSDYYDAGKLAMQMLENPSS